MPTDEVVEADICIVGAGPAGLTIASEFIGTGRRVYVLESGAEHLEPDTVELGDGDNVGHPYFELAGARARALGGSSYIWDEWMRTRPFDEIDFARRDWVPNSGWPLSRDQLMDYYRRAHEALDLGPFRYETEDHPMIEASPDLRSILFRFSNTADFTRRRASIDASNNVVLVLKATAVELVPGRAATHLEKVSVAAADGQRFELSAKVFVLAAGGFDTPRLLLASTSRSPNGIGNDNDLVGRFFMEHPVLRRGAFVPAADQDGDEWLLPFQQHVEDGFSVRSAIGPSQVAMERDGLLNAMLLLKRSTRLKTSETYRSVAILRDRVKGVGERGDSTMSYVGGVLSRPGELTRTAMALARGRDETAPAYHLSMTIEQAPDASSRVRLGRRKDRFGVPVPELDWRLGDLERATARRLQELLDEAVSAAGLGHVEGFLGEERPPRRFRGEWHQMGTTRMSATPRQGVVDSDCLVHGMNNLYIAGSSVFPTVGFANPTLTLVALAYRLADRVGRSLEGTPSLGPIW